jgi:phosphoglycolate phosphatase
MTVRLAIFDCDGTLVDSQHNIVTAMQGAFEAASLTCPERTDILSIIGLSLPQAMAKLLPGADDDFCDLLAGHYRQCFRDLRAAGVVHEPLYDGIADLLDNLEAQGWLLAVATGKSDRGLANVLAHHGLSARFISLQTADRHPSKPHPSMIAAALSDAGAHAQDAVMIGDTSFDMLMAGAAGVPALGVGWGYHQPGELFASGARSVAQDSAELARHIGLG